MNHLVLGRERLEMTGNECIGLVGHALLGRHIMHEAKYCICICDDVRNLSS